MNQEDIEKKEKLNTDPDFIDAPKYGNSMKTFFEENPNKDLNDNQIARMLGLTANELNDIYTQSLKKLKKFITGS